MQHSIDIKPIEIDISQEMYRFYCIWNEIDGAFFEFGVNSGKGHRFFIGVFRKLSTYFYRQAGVSGSFMLSDAPAFLFSESYHLVIQKGVRNHVQ